MGARLAAILALGLATWPLPSAADEAPFAHAAGTVGDGRTVLGLDVATSWGRGPAEISPGLRLSHGFHRRAEIGLRLGVLGDSVDGFRPSTGLQIPILFEVSLGALPEQETGWSLGVTLVGGLRNFGGDPELSQPEGGLEVGASLRLSGWALAFARCGYFVTRVGQKALPLGRDQGGPAYGQGQPLLRHYPSVALGLEFAVLGLRPFVGVQGGLRLDPNQDAEPRVQALAGAAYVF